SNSVLSSTIFGQELNATSDILFRIFACQTCHSDYVILWWQCDVSPLRVDSKRTNMTEVTQQHPSTHPSTGAPTDHGSAKLIFNWLKLAESALGNNSDRLNAINIFPVPDGD